MRFVFGAGVLALATACPQSALPQAASPQVVALATGESAQIEGTSLKVTLLAARGPGEDCFDCPLKAVVRVDSGAETQELRYSFSPNMQGDRLAAARLNTAFGFAFEMRRIDDDGATIRVQRASQ